MTKLEALDYLKEHLTHWPKPSDTSHISPPGWLLASVEEVSSVLPPECLYISITFAQSQGTVDNPDTHLIDCQEWLNHLTNNTRLQ